MAVGGWVLTDIKHDLAPCAAIVSRVIMGGWWPSEVSVKDLERIA